MDHNDVVEDVWSSGKSGEWQIDYKGSRASIYTGIWSTGSIVYNSNASATGKGKYYIFEYSGF